MSTIDVAALPHTEGVLRFLDAEKTQGKPYILAYEDPNRPATNWVYDDRKVRIHNARPLAEKEGAAALKLDREGFEFHQHESKVDNFYDEEQLRTVYYPEVVELVKAATGAQDVLVFDHTIRAPKEKSHRQPVLLVHNDYTEESAPQRIRDLTDDPALLAQRLSNRYAFINVWRPILPRGFKVEELPLAVNHAQALKPEDYLVSDLIYKDRVGGNYAIKYAEHQRWFYFPDMHRDEVLFLKVFDSLVDGHTARFVAHTAFADPNTPPNPRPRESIEIRTIAFFGASRNE